MNAEFFAALATEAAEYSAAAGASARAAEEEGVGFATLVLATMGVSGPIGLVSLWGMCP